MKTIKKLNGFTIIELLTVVSLLAILSFTFYSRMSDSNVYKGENNVRNMVYLLKQAQKTAIAQRRNIYVIQNGFNVNLCYLSGATCSVANQVLQQGKAVSIVLDSGITISSGISYLPNGNSNADYSFTVKTKTIKIDRISGYVYDI